MRSTTNSTNDPWRNATTIRITDDLAMLPTAGPEVSNVVILTPWKSTTPRSIPGTRDGVEDRGRATTRPRVRSEKD